MQNPSDYGAPAGGAATGKSSTGLDANVASILAYVFGWVGGLVFFLIEKESGFVRFHAMQSLLLSAAVIVISIPIFAVYTILLIISTELGLLFSLVWMLLVFAILAAVILCCVKAYQGHRFKLPFIGDLAERFTSK